MKKLFAVLAVVSFTAGCAVTPPDLNGKPMHSTHFIANKTPATGAGEHRAAIQM